MVPDTSPTAVAELQAEVNRLRSLYGDFREKVSLAVFGEQMTGGRSAGEILRQLDRVVERAAAIRAAVDGTRLMPTEDVNNLDDVVRELGIEDEVTTPAEAVRELKAEIERLRSMHQDMCRVAGEQVEENERLRAGAVSRASGAVPIPELPGQMPGAPIGTDADEFDRPSPRPSGSNADGWHLYLAENTDALPMVAVGIAESIEAAGAKIWAEFVALCEALETEAAKSIDTIEGGPKPHDQHAHGFYRGQLLAAKSIRRSVEHPKYAPKSPDNCPDAVTEHRMEIGRLQAERARLRKALEKIAFITGGIDTLATSNAAHYEATNALTSGERTHER